MLVTLVVLPAGMRPLVRLLVAFNVGFAAFLVLLFLLVGGADANEVRALSKAIRHSRGRVFAGVLLACASSLVAVGLVLRAAGSNRAAFRTELMLSAVTVFAAWLLLQSVFAMYYANCYYQPGTAASDSADGDQGGIQFAGKEPPDFFDFVYFSFTIGTCYATSDTPITSRMLRRAALLQMLVSFLFYTFLVGMVINAIGALLEP